MVTILICIAVTIVVGVLWYDKGYKDGKKENEDTIKMVSDIYLKKGKKNEDD